MIRNQRTVGDESTENKIRLKIKMDWMPTSRMTGKNTNTGDAKE